MNRKSPIIIGIAGGTGSGKSTFTNRLKDAFGDQVTVLYHDNYYRAHDDMPFEQRKKLNYDHPDAFETELLLGSPQSLPETVHIPPVPSARQFHSLLRVRVGQAPGAL